jgi:hypothetical protein
MYYAETGVAKNAVMSEILSVKSSTQKNNIQNGGNILNDRFSAGQKENTKIVLTEEKSDDTRTLIRRTTTKFLCWLTIQSRVSNCSADLRLCPHNIKAA